jgi:hypothetical protein
MKKLPSWCDEAATVHWPQIATELPSWEEAHRRLVEEGRVSPVERPSTDQMEKRIPPPRVTMSRDLAAKPAT